MNIELDQIKLIDYAIKGINADVDKLERSIEKGRKLLKDIEKGIASDSKKSPDEIRQIIAAKKAEIESLVKYENEIKWKQLELKGEI